MEHAFRFSTNYLDHQFYFQGKFPRLNLALRQREPQLFLQAGGSADGLSDDEVASQIAARADAKKNKNFAESDKIRAELLAQGIVLEDKPGGITEWRRA